MLYWLKRIWMWFFPATEGYGTPQERHHIPTAICYRTQLFDDRSAAAQAATESQVLAVVQSGGKKKWALLRCPCGCGEDLALNLMRSHRPVWDLSLDGSGRASLHPSVHATTCGAHFWLRSGFVIWCE
jgi:hypothetical protein